MAPMTRPCKECGNEFEPDPDLADDNLCDDCANKEPARLDRMKVLCFSMLYFYLPDDFEGGLGDALRAMADYHDAVKRRETKHPPSLEPNAFDRETITVADHEAETWDRFCEGIEGGSRVCGSVCMADFVRGDDEEWTQMFMDLSNGQPNETATCQDSVEERAFVVDLIKADELTPNGRLYSAELLQTIADQAAESIAKQPLSIVHFDEDDFEKLAANPAQQIDRIGLVRHLRFDGQHLVARGIPMVGKAFAEGARIVPVMEGIVLQEGPVAIVEKATIVRFDLLPPKDKD